MDLNSKVINVVPSLQSRCAISLTSRLLFEEDLTSPHSQNYGKLQLMRMLKSIDSLHYPSRLKTFLSDQLRESYSSVTNWMDMFCLGLKPVLSNDGTVDGCRSARAIVDDEKIGRFERFVVACIFCFEESVFRIGSQMNEYELSIVKSKLIPEFQHSYADWERYLKTLLCFYYYRDTTFKTVLDNLLNPLVHIWFVAVHGGRDYLTREECMTALDMALYCDCFYEIKFYAEKLSSEDCATCLYKHVDSMRWDYGEMFILNHITFDHHLSIWPKRRFSLVPPEALIQLLNKISSPTNQQRLMPIFAVLILSNILDCPNTEIFKRAISFFGPHLIPETYLKLLVKIFATLRYSRPKCGSRLEILDVFWDFSFNLSNADIFISDLELDKCSRIIDKFFRNDEEISKIASQSYVNDWRLLLQRYQMKIRQLYTGISLSWSSSEDCTSEFFCG